MIQTPDGREFYTRNGQFGVNARGELVTQSGNLVSPGIDIPGDANHIQIDEDGTISAIYDSGARALQVADFINPWIEAWVIIFMPLARSGAPLFMDLKMIIVRQGFIEGLMLMLRKTLQHNVHLN